MSIDEGLRALVEEGMAPLGHVRSRSMMGGLMLYCDGLPFALLAQDWLWFKSDAISDSEWDAACCPRFGYLRKGQVATLNYRRAPDDCLDDPDELRRWGGLAVQAAIRAAAAKKSRKR